MTDHKPLDEGEVATHEEAAQVQRTLGALDGLADLWAANNDIPDQLRRMLGGGASPDWIALLLRWTKQAFVEGAYEGRTSATDEVKALKAEIERLRAPILIDGEAVELVRWLNARADECAQTWGAGNPYVEKLRRAASYISRTAPQADHIADASKTVGPTCKDSLQAQEGEARELVERLRSLISAEPVYDCRTIRDAASFIERTAGREATEEETHKFLTRIYVQGWDQHIGSDGATAIQNALARAGLRIMKVDK